MNLTSVVEAVWWDGFVNNDVSLHDDLVRSLESSSSSLSSTSSASCDACGWMAAVGSMLAFGSFGVPIKSRAALAVDIDPLVFQSYKTFVCFVTSWLVLLFRVDFSFSPWGIVSGLFWVPAGVATIYAVKSAGLAIGIGIGNSFIVLVSFIWGIFIFNERVHSRWGASFAVLCMMLGLFGMSYFSNPQKKSEAHVSEDEFEGGHPHPVAAAVGAHPSNNKRRLFSPSYGRSGSYQNIVHRINDEEAYGGFAYGDGDNNEPVDEGQLRRDGGQQLPSNNNMKGGNGTKYYSSENDGKVAFDEMTMKDNGQQQGDGGAAAANEKNPLKLTERTVAMSSFSDHSTSSAAGDEMDSRNKNNNNVTTGIIAATPTNGRYASQQPPDDIVQMRLFCCFGKDLAVRKRYLGMMSAMFCGLWGGSIMAPMKWCESDDTKGVGYLISFAVGASVVTLTLWILRFLYYVSLYGSTREAYCALPSFHVRTLWLAGCTCGLLWSAGNFFSLISVYYLGEGVGYPLVQTSMLVSGLWGIFYFREIQGAERISKWILSSMLTIFGILLLSYMHHEK